MTKEVIIAVLEDISKDMERDLIEADEGWNNGKDHAMLVGYLEAALASAKRRIDSITKK